MMIRINIKHIRYTVNIDLIRVERKHISLRMDKGWCCIFSCCCIYETIRQINDTR